MAATVVAAIGLAQRPEPVAAQVVEPCRYGLVASSDDTLVSEPFEMAAGTSFVVRAISSGAANSGTGQLLFIVEVFDSSATRVWNEDFLHQVFPTDQVTRHHRQAGTMPTAQGPFTVSVRAVSNNPFPSWFSVTAWMEVLVPDGKCPVPENDAVGGRNGGANGSDGEAGDPVSTSTGNLFHRLPTPADQALWRPTYNSLDTWTSLGGNGKQGVFGTKWASLLDARSIPVQVDPGNTGLPPRLFVRMPTGRTFVVAAGPTANVWEPPGEMAAESLVRVPGTGTTWTFLTGAVWTFNARGFLMAIEDGRGGRIDITRTSIGVPTKLVQSYDGVLGHAWTFVDTGEAGLIDEVVGPYDADLSTPPADVPRTALTYSGNRLASVSAPYRTGDAVQTREAYAYVAKNRMATITQHRGGALPPVVVVTTTYDAFGRVDVQTTATGEVDDFTYTRVGSSWTTTVEHHDGPAIETVVYGHDPKLRLTSVEDPFGEVLSWDWVYDRPVWHGTRRGAEAFGGWDSDQRISTLGLPDPEVAGQLSGEVEVTYCAPGDPRTVDVTDAAGVVTRTWWTTGTDPFVCDAGRTVPVKVTRAHGTAAAADTTFTEADGLVASQTDADGVRTDFAWEPGRALLLSRTDYPDGPTQPGRTTFFGYDAAGRQIAVRDPGGVETWSVRDAAGRVTQQVGPVTVARTCGTTSCTFGTTPPSGPTRSWTYDLDGGLLASTDEAGQVTTFATAHPSGGGRVETVTAPAHGDDATDPLSRVATVTTSTYDRFDRLVTVEVGDPSDPSSVATTSYLYDPLGRVRQQSRQVGGGQADLVESYAYDADGNQTRVVRGTDPGDTDRAVAVRRYDLRGRLVEEWGPTGDASAPTSVSGTAPAAVRQHSQWVYDDADRLLAEIVGDGTEQQTTYHRYDEAGRPRFVIVDRDGDQVVSASATGGPTDDTDDVTEYAYTAAGRLDRAIASPVNALSFSWVSGNQANKNTTAYTYDGAGQLVSTTNPQAKITTQDWNTRGQLERVTRPGGHWTEYGYDDGGRATRVTSPSPTGTGTVDVLTGYDARGLLTSETDAHPSGTSGPATRTFAYYDDGSLATATNPLGGPNGTVGYTYDARGNRTARTSWSQTSGSAAPHQIVDTWTYDLADRPTSEQPAGAASPTATTYDPVTGWADEVTQPSGRVTTTSYWNSGLVRSVTTTKPSDAHGPADTSRACSWYDTAGQRRHLLDDDLTGGACTAGAVTTETWNAAGQRATVTAPDTSQTPSGVDETLAFSWYTDGRLRQITLPDGGGQRWTYSRSGQTVSVVRPGAGTIADYTYDTHGRLRSETTGGGAVTRTWTLHTNGSPAPRRVVETATGEATRTTDITYRPDGRVGSETTDGRTLAWSYDAAGQVTGRTDTNGPDHAYTYGPRGLRLSETVDGITRTSTYDDGARLTGTTGPSGTTTYGYDADGRRVDVTLPGASTPLHTTYDSRGLPVEIDLSPTTAQARQHDADGRLVEIAETGVPTRTQVWNPDQPTWQAVVARDPAGSRDLEHAAHGLVGDRDDTGTVTPYRQDRQRSTTTSTAVPTAPAVYEPFGQGGDPTQLAGYRAEGLIGGLVHLRNRDYDPTTGTFTTRDPLDGISGTPTETNPYHYADNDPSSKTDPLGLSPSDASIWGFVTAPLAIPTLAAAAPTTGVAGATGGAAAGGLCATGIGCIVVIGVVVIVAVVVGVCLFTSACGGGPDSGSLTTQGPGQATEGTPGQQTPNASPAPVPAPGGTGTTAPPPVSTGAPACGPDAPGPEETYHRRNSPTQTDETALQQLASGEIWGGVPRGGWWRQVQAYRGPLPSGKPGVEFRTRIRPNVGGPGEVRGWNEHHPSACEVPEDDDFVKIKVQITKVVLKNGGQVFP